MTFDGSQATAYSNEEKTSIYVGNLFYGTMESEVRELFSQYGTVLAVKLMMDWRRGRFRGFAFVEMPPAEAVNAIEALNGYEFQGRELKVNEARPGN